MPIERQTSFAAGEISPRLYGRTDLPTFRHGVRTLENFFISRTGNAVTRPGTKMLRKCKQATVVLKSFSYSDTLHAVLEFGDYYVRVHDVDCLLSMPEVVTTLTAAWAAEATYAQVGSKLYISHQSTGPVVLEAPSSGDLFAGTWTFGNARFTPPAISSSIGAALEAVFLSSGGVSYWEPMLGDVTAGSLFSKDSTHPPRQWTWKVSTLFQNSSTGEVRESTAFTVIRYLTGATYAAGVATMLPSGVQVVCDPETPVKIYFSTVGGGYTPPNWVPSSDWQPVSQVFYRGRGELFGYVGQSVIATGASGLYVFTDNGDEPDYTRQPLRSTDPFPSRQPAAVAFYQQRLALAGSTSEPTTVRFSAVDNWENFDELVGPFIAPDMPLEFTLAHSRREEIRQMLALEHLVIGTNSGLWALGPAQGSDGFGISAQFVRLSDEGVSRVPMLPVESGVVVNPARGFGARMLVPAQGGVSVADMSWHVDHLFAPQAATGFGGAAYTTPYITSWAYAHHPFGLLWVALSDGSLLSCTRTGESQWAWARHTTGGTRHLLPGEAGAADVFDVSFSVVSLCSIRLPTRDAVFQAVTRRGGTWLEVQNSRDAQGTVYGFDENFCLDSYVVYSDKGLWTVAGPNELELNGLLHLKGMEVYAVIPGNPTQGPFTVDETGTITIEKPKVQNQVAALASMAVGLKYTCSLETLDSQAGALHQRTTTRVGFEVEAAPGFEVGEDFDHLTTVRARAVADGYSVPSAANQLAVVNVKGTWSRAARAVLRQSNPAPLTVYGVTREVTNGQG